MPNAKASESVNQVRPKSINNVRLIRQYKHIFFVFEMRTERWNVKYLICFTIHVILLNVLFWINLIILNDLEMTLKIIKTMYNKHLNES